VKQIGCATTGISSRFDIAFCCSVEMKRMWAM
jgi:hypothetical protein